MRRERGRKRGSKNQDGLFLVDIVPKGYFLLESYLVFVSKIHDSLFLYNDPHAREWAGA